MIGLSPVNAGAHRSCGSYSDVIRGVVDVTDPPLREGAFSMVRAVATASRAVRTYYGALKGAQSFFYTHYIHVAL